MISLTLSPARRKLCGCFSLEVKTMANTIGSETVVDYDFECEEAELLKRAREKPTLRMINAN